MENKPKKPLSMKHLLIAAGVSTALAMGVSIGVTAAIVGKQDRLPTYTVTFVNDDDTVLQTTKVKIGGTAIFSGEPSKSNPEEYIDYAFTGWDKPLTNILADTTIKAQYLATHQTFTAIWLNEDGSEWGRDENCDKYEMSKGKVPTCSKGLPTKPIESGKQYIFSKWNSEDEGWKTGTWTATATFDSAPEKMVIENGVVTKYTGTSTNVEIPTQWAGQTVTSIGAGAFKTATAVQSVTIPNTITKIGSNAFDGMSALTTVTFEQGTKITEIPEYAFNNCIGLTEFTVPDSVTTLHDYAFAGCSSMTKINIGAGVRDIDDVKGIGAKTFTGCSSLVDITAIGNDYFHTVDGVQGILFGKSAIPQGSIAVKCMPGVTSIDASKLPEDLWLITSGAFEESKIKTINLSNCNVSVIGEGAFANSEIESFTSGDVLAGFGDKAFDNCTKLKSISLGKNVASIGIQSSTFAGCISLETITVDSNNIELASDDGCLYTKDYSELLRCPPAHNTPTLHKDCEILGQSCFEKCSKLTTYTVPTSIVEIKQTAFSKCDNLTEVTWGQSANLKTLGKWIFQDCEKLATINIGAGIEFSASFDAEALGGCKSLATINVDSGSTTLESVNGVLYTKNFPSQKWLVKCPAAKTDIETFTVPSDVTHIANSSFDSCTHIKKIILPATIIDIYNLAFQNCTSLETFELAEGYSFTGDSQKTTCLAGCTNFKNVIIHKIDGYTKDILSYFYKRMPVSGTKLNLELNLGSVTEISGTHLQGISTVDTITLDTGITSIGKEVFQKCEFSSIVLPDTLESIGYHAFIECSKLTNVNVPSTLTTISNGAFGSCTGLTNLDFSSSNIEVISPYTFGSCSNLTEIKLPASLTSLGDYAFDRCTKLTSVYFAGTVEQFKAITSTPRAPFTGLDQLHVINCSGEELQI